MKYTKMQSQTLLVVALVALLAFSTATANAAVLSVDGANVGCSDLTGTPYCTIGAAVAAAGPNDTINVAAHTYGESGIAVDKALTIAGAGPGSTIVDPGGSGIIFYVDADGVTFKDLTIQNGSQGVRFEMAGGTIDDTEINNVEFRGNSSRGIEIHNDTTATNLRVLNSLFDNNNVGIRWASSGVGEGVLVDQTTFRNHSGLGIYEANDGSTGYVRDLTITNSEFENNGWAIYGEELRGVLVHNNMFRNQERGFYLWRAYNGASVLAGDIIISNNEFQDHSAASILIVGEDRVGYPYLAPNTSIDLPVMITGNTITQDVGVLAANWAQIDIRLFAGAPHASVTVQDNTVSFSGSFVGASAAYAAKVRGDFDGVTFIQNTFQGGGVSDSGVPPTSGIFLVTNDSYWGSTSSTSVGAAVCNTITGFVNGVSTYDVGASSFGGLPTGAQLYVNFNNIAGNSGYGINNGAASSSETIDATNNWWGASDGPSGVGPGTGDAVSFNVDFNPFLTKVQTGCQGFVTGGGIVESPVGADAENPDATGPATFGFVSKYVKGKTTPEGNLVFFFKAGDLHFKSTSMGSLVVTGQPRAVFRGVGTINDGAVCKFEVDSWDGSFDSGVDAFGLKLHGCDTGIEDRYLLGATPLTKGSITIHKK